MRYPMAGRDQLARLMTGSGLAAAAAGLGVALATRTAEPFALALAVAVGLIWLGRTFAKGFVEVGDDKVRVKLGALFDETIPLPAIAEIGKTSWSLLGGLGVRTNFRGTVAVVTRTGSVADIGLREPRRLPVIPKVLHVRARRLVVSPGDLDSFLDEMRARLDR